MSKITQFDRATVKALRDSLDTALKTIETQFGISVNVGSASFTPENVTFKVGLAVVGTSGQVMTREASAFKQSAILYGLKPENLFQTFTDYSGEERKDS